MLKKVVGFAVSALLLSNIVAYSQPHTMYHWRSFSENASVGNEEYYINIEKYGPLDEIEGWPTLAAVWFYFFQLGVGGDCPVSPDDIEFNRVTGEVRLDTSVSPGQCFWLDGASAFRLEVTWAPDGSFHSRRHYTLLGDMNGTSSEQGWMDSWRNAEVTGSLWLDDAPVSTPISWDPFGGTDRTWGHGVIPHLSVLTGGRR